MALERTATVPTPRTAEVTVEVELEEPPAAAEATDFTLIRVPDHSEPATWDFTLWEA